MNKHYFYTYPALIAILLVNLIILTGCKNNDENTGPGTLEFAIKDAPIDNESIRGVIVTIADIKINGESWDGMEEKVTVDLMAYQNVNTKLLGSGPIPSGNHQNVSLVVDFSSDKNGNTPGCYVETNNDTTYRINAPGSLERVEYPVNGSINIESDKTNKVVCDFDIRKALRTTASGNYRLIKTDQSEKAIRLSAADQTGTLEGVFEAPTVQNQKFVVYAYPSGSFNNNETTLKTNDSIRFINAVHSSKIEYGQYSMHHMQEDSYELEFARYTQDTDQETWQFDQMVSSDITLKASGDVSLTIDNVPIKPSNNTFVQAVLN